ncbi:mucin-13 [Falco naumanni]|uniref:mucin-13 n=1 Tax=Falco naumanni TaxID=148594 RepID=UPI001ADE1D2E|nr:mucin-13 [Falco naumanni]
MRRCVFLAVLLSLVLSLLKGKNTEASSTLPGTPPATTGKNTEASSTLPGTPPATTGKNTEASSTLPGTPPATTGKNTEASSTLPGTPPATTGNNTEANSTLPGTPPATTGNNTEANSTLPGTPPATTGNNTEANSTLPGTPPATTAVDTASSSTTAPGEDFCSGDPCGKALAKCIALNSSFICQCQYGFYYSNKDCYRGKIFPGVITLKRLYSSSLQIVNSAQYEEVYENITVLFQNAFQGLTGFVQTVIVEIQPLQEIRAAVSVRVTVINLFKENSTVNNDTVTSAINTATEYLTYVSHYTATTYCAVFLCDDQTTDCEEGQFPKCTCKSSFSKTEWDDRSCSVCSKDCSAEENEYCAKEENGVPTCKCKPDFEKKDQKCVPCPIGYSGENCKDNSELILIIVGTVFGAVILCLVIAISVVSVRARHKQDPEKKNLIKSGYSKKNTFDADDRQTTMFPRVQTTSGHANPGYQPNNPYEMRSANRRRFPERDYDDLYEVSREPEGFRMQSRY